MEKIIAIVGKGNVATHLVKALDGKGEVHHVDSRTLDGFPERCDICLISVADKAIAEVAEKVKGRAEIIAHTSGSIPMDSLKDTGERYGVFYPLQTFTKGVELDYSEIPFFIEGSDATTAEELKALAKEISSNVREADSPKRKQLHLASVFACNFANSLVGIADNLLKDAGMDYKVLLPLLRQTIGKLDTLSPAEAQTGPAARRDYPVIDAHLSMLASRPAYREIYRLLTDNILNLKNDNNI